MLSRFFKKTPLIIQDQTLPNPSEVMVLPDGSLQYFFDDFKNAEIFNLFLHQKKLDKEIIRDIDHQNYICLTPNEVMQFTTTNFIERINLMDETTCYQWANLANIEIIKLIAITQSTKDLLQFLNLFSVEHLNQLMQQKSNFKVAFQFLDKKSFTSLFLRLSKETCLHILNNTNDLIEMIEEHPEVYPSFVRKVGFEAFKKVLLKKNNDGRTVLMSLVENIETKSLKQLILKLPPSICDQAVTQFSNSDHNVLYSFAIYEPKIFKLFISKITPQSCRQHAKTLDIDLTPFFILIIRELSVDNLYCYLEKLFQDGSYETLKIKGNFGESILEILAAISPQTLIVIINFLPPTILLDLINQKSKNTIVFIRLLKHCTDPTVLSLLFEKIYQNPELIPPSFLQLIELHIYDGGGSKDEWSRLAKYFIKFAPIPRLKKVNSDVSYLLDNPTAYIPWQSNFLSRLEPHGLRFLRIQGRTLLLQDQQGQILALKIQKQNEPLQALSYEYHSLSNLIVVAKSLKLKSSFPTPLSLSFHTDGLLTWIKPQISEKEFADLILMIGDKPTHAIYIYKVKPECDYFTYLHDIKLSDETFAKANHNIVHDLFILLANGVVFNQLADLFHNSEHVTDRGDKGRYLVLVNLLRSYMTGSGRLTGWKEAVAFPNLRASGIADFGDRTSINYYLTFTELVKNFFSEAIECWETKVGNFLLANVMAEYQYVLFLIAGRRASELTAIAKKNHASNTDIVDIWIKAATQIFNNCVYAISLLSYKPQDEIRNFMLKIINIERLAFQMCFWMTDENIKPLLQNTIPKGLYGEETKVNLQINQFRQDTFNEKIGCSIDGIHQDLGAVNGQEPIKEANKLLYWMVIMIFHSYHQLSLTAQEVHQIKEAPDFQSSEALRKNAFSYLADKPYHTIQAELCSERLKQPLPKATKRKLEKEAHYHQEKRSALTISQFWLKHRKSSVNERTEESPAKRSRTSSY